MMGRFVKCISLTVS